PGSFDPITNGHIDIIERSLEIFDEVIVVIAMNLRKTSSKSQWFTPEERADLVRKVFRGQRRVKVDLCDGLIMDYARKHRVSAVLRGLRAASDFEAEFMMAAINRELNDSVETVFMMTGKNLFFVSSTVLKEVAAFGGSIRPYVPKAVHEAVGKKLRSEGLV
ncbi:MAG: pantetheine-phosphate adenylyltransferase, partial [Bdellovibrionales bacterium]|nr:pantetheine-phosphate adenylyltransferase [Bdellovibrionales bacterium]